MYTILCGFQCFSDSRDVMNGHRMRVHSVKYHPTDSHMLISGGWDDTVQVIRNLLMTGTRLSLASVGPGVACLYKSQSVEGGWRT